MTGHPPEPVPRECAAIFVFALWTRVEDLAERVSRVEGAGPIVCLSTHHLFDLERRQVEERTSSEVLFLSFADLLSEEEMETCDAEADRQIAAEIGRFKNLGRYYGRLLKLKNERVQENLARRFEAPDRQVLSSGLGIHPQVWTRAGFVDRAPVEVPSPPRWRHWLRRFGDFLRQLGQPLEVARVRAGGEDVLVLGRLAKMAQYLRDDLEIDQLPPPAARPLIALCVCGGKLAVNLFGRRPCRVICRIHAWRLRRHLPNGWPRRLTAAIHEESDDFGLLAERLGWSLAYMQDGHLPGHFSSCYLRYFHNVETFLVWDRLSGRIFDTHGLPWRESGLFKTTRLEPLPAAPLDVRSAVVLTSGAGDWTAVKNRSDEDRMFEVFVEVARRCPELRIVYRPHPLWVDPNFHGPDSIDRLYRYVLGAGLRNLVISEGTRRESLDYARDRQVSRQPTSILEEIRAADVVFGDHSQTMLNAARMGKVFASVNVSPRRSLFDDYNQLGFPAFDDADGIIAFLEALRDSSRPIREFNRAVERFNQAVAPAP